MFEQLIINTYSTIATYVFRLYRAFLICPILKHYTNLYRDMWLRNLSSEKQPAEIMIKCGFTAVDIFSRYISALVPTVYTYLGRHKIGAGRKLR